MKVFFFLMAGGQGKRARPLSLVKPKPAFQLGGRPLIDIMLEQLAGHGLEQGFVNLFHLPEHIEACIEDHEKRFPGSKIARLYEEKLSGSEILREAAGSMEADDLLLVVNGDIFLEIPYKEMLHELLLHRCHGVLLVRPQTTPKDRTYRMLIVENGRFLGREDPPHGKNRSNRSNVPTYMYPGVALLGRAVVERIRQVSYFETLAEHSFHIRAWPYTGIWLDIGTPPDYDEAKEAYRRYREGN
jgi:NDP-sugar pyrophosphorylase family protein